jgi:hypothetical protein
MDKPTADTVNFILDLVLVAASIWMIVAARGVGGIFGKTMTLIVIGAIILGVAHLLATLGTRITNATGGPLVDPNLNNVIHRLIVLAGFVFMVFGFRQLAEIKR